MALVNILTLFLNFSLVSMMIITKRRTPENPRPDDLETSLRRRTLRKGLLFQEYQELNEDPQTSGADFLDIKMSKKIIEQNVDKNREQHNKHMIKALSELERVQLQITQGPQYEFTVTCLKLNHKP